jgi:hypothetical protein
MAGYDCSRRLDEVDILHVDRNQLSGLLQYRYCRFQFDNTLVYYVALLKNCILEYFGFSDTSLPNIA